MSVRYVRDEERIAVELNKTRAGLSDVQRPTGTEKAQTMDVAEQAQGDAQAAAAAAATAETLAKGAVTFATEQPTAADAAGKPLGALWTVLVSNSIESYWELTAFGWAQRPLSTTVIPQINIGTGTFGVLAGSRLAADAIDGKTVTGATLRTAATGQRMQFDENGLRGFNSTNEEIARLDLTTNGFRLRKDGTTTGPAQLDLLVNEFSLSEVKLTSGSGAGIEYIARLLASKDSGSALHLFNNSGYGSVHLESMGSQIRADNYRNLDNGISASYAAAGGRFTTPAVINPGGYIEYGVAFPANRFTVPPLITGLESSQARFNLAKINVTKDGFLIGIANWSPGAAGAGAVIDWKAEQLTRTAATG